MTGIQIAQARWVSINLVLLIGLIYCSVAVHTSGFGSYKQLLGLMIVQNLFAHFLIAFGILVGIVTGRPNIYTAPEFSGGGNGANWFHILLHVVIAGPILSILAWL